MVYSPLNGLQGGFTVISDDTVNVVCRLRYVLKSLKDFPGILAKSAVIPSIKWSHEWRWCSHSWPSPITPLNENCLVDSEVLPKYHVKIGFSISSRRISDSHEQFLVFLSDFMTRIASPGPGNGWRHTMWSLAYQALYRGLDFVFIRKCSMAQSIVHVFWKATNIVVWFDGLGSCTRRVSVPWAGILHLLA